MSTAKNVETGLFDNKHRNCLLLFRKEYHREKELGKCNWKEISGWMRTEMAQEEEEIKSLKRK